MKNQQYFVLIAFDIISFQQKNVECYLRNREGNGILLKKNYIGLL